MYGYKGDLDGYFMSNWQMTPIQFDGASFSVPNGNRWISIKLIPLTRDLIGIAPQHGRKKDMAQLQVLCYDVSATLSYELCREVRDFIECKEIDTRDNTKLLVDVGEGDGNGAVPLDNGIYETMIQFDITHYE